MHAILDFVGQVDLLGRGRCEGLLVIISEGGPSGDLVILLDLQRETNLQRADQLEELQVLFEGKKATEFRGAIDGDCRLTNLLELLVILVRQSDRCLVLILFLLVDLFAVSEDKSLRGLDIFIIFEVVLLHCTAEVWVLDIVLEINLVNDLLTGQVGDSFAFTSALKLHVTQFLF